jgi:hypothetical protein
VSKNYFRPKIVAILGTERNTWMWSFAHASNRISQAIIDGKTSTEDIEHFPLDGDNESACRALAEAAGMRWGPDWPEERATVDGEDVEIAVQAIRALTMGDIGTYEEEGAGGPNTTWMLYDETLAEFGVTADGLRAALQGINIQQAATLIVGADNWYHMSVTR